MKKTFKFLAVLVGLVCAIQFTSCQSCQRELKNIGSDWGGGLNRTLTVYDYEGNVLAVYKGKFDIRDNGSDNQMFFDLDGKRIWIQGGIVISEEQ